MRPIGHTARSIWRLGAPVLLCVATAGAANADAVADFYSGRTVSLIIGFPPGGGYDAYLRTLQRHLGRFIPGNPTVVASNMPGAGSLVALNHIYAKAGNDGTVLAGFASSALMEALLGNKAALFDATNFSWIGSMSQEVAYCGVWQRPGAPTSFDEMMTKETMFGAGAPAAITFQHPTIMKNVLGARIRVIGGYPGTREINLAMHRGEVNASCGMLTSTVKTQFLDDVTSGRLKLVIQMGNKRSDEFGTVSSVFDYAKSDAEKAVLDVHFGQLLLGRPLAGPPEIPPDRLKALRAAFLATMQDRDFLADAARVGLEIDPATAEEVHDLLKRFSALPPEIIRKAQQAMGR